MGHVYNLKNSLKFKLLAFRRKKNPFIDQKCTYEKVTTILAGPSPPHLDNIQNNSSFSSWDSSQGSLAIADPTTQVNTSQCVALGQSEVGKRLCAHHGDLAAAQICFGDSGGPLILEETGSSMVIGVASRQKPAVPGQCTKDRLAFYTRVQDFLPWIKEVAGVTDKTAEGKF